MRTESRAEQVRIITATIFNKLHPDAEPAGDYYELTDEEGTEADRRQWQAIEAGVQQLPPDALAGLRALFDDLERATDIGCIVHHKC